jgi:hypothetical protein
VVQPDLNLEKKIIKKQLIVSREREREFGEDPLTFCNFFRGSNDLSLKFKFSHRGCKKLPSFQIISRERIQTHPLVKRTVWRDLTGVESGINR